MATDDSLVRTLLIVIVVLLLLPFLVMALAMPLMGMWGGGHMWNGGTWDAAGGGWMWLLTGIVPLVVALAIGYLLYSALQQPDAGRTDPAIEELRTAYARGELSDEEFEKRRERLERDR
ncbi:SHOCT domain-containing protein [Natrarchaeobius oligotrophus]|uniref:SHOCT domain-containing protein n=1 Tax=Natrarchaeobius chitinivorans TaxID=1679083 RepID=A0A3N6MFP9_NATCH|nr:SHOCT domain-containing protein [Natrarchaeobius chitinivorans]RQH01768.1 SHOCT domain-containing protein [Natrarchaeobius chitinivorans]